MVQMGTIFDTINLLMKIVDHPILMHILPLGTGNDLFYSHKLTYDIRPIVK